MPCCTCKGIAVGKMPWCEDCLQYQSELRRFLMYQTRFIEAHQALLDRLSDNCPAETYGTLSPVRTIKSKSRL